MKKFYCIILLCFLILNSTFADSFVPGYYYVGDYDIYIDNLGEVTILAYYGNDTNVVIPGQFDGFVVTKIGSSAFYQKRMETIVIPDTVLYIDDNAFKYCKNLASLSLPNSLLTIGESAFEGCSNLSSIVIPDSVSKMGKYTFFSCSKLVSVTVIPRFQLIIYFGSGVQFTTPTARPLKQQMSERVAPLD